MSKTKAVKTVTALEAGEVYQLPARVEVGLVPCPGEAHTNPFIDNCMICLGGKFGYVMSYEPLTPAACKKGVAVPVNWTGKRRALVDNAFEVAENAGQIKMVMVAEKVGKTSRSSYFVYVVA